MEQTPNGTSVGVDDPYEHAGHCEHCTDRGQCRFAREQPHSDPAFARERARDSFRCPVADPDGDWTEWADCLHYRFHSREDECLRCGLTERLNAHTDARPLLERHHLSYDTDQEPSHELTVTVCRWCHAAVHSSWARLTDDVEPDPAAIAASEGRRSEELEECSFETASERVERSEDPNR